MFKTNLPFDDYQQKKLKFYLLVLDLWIGLHFDVLGNWQWLLKKKSPFWLPQGLARLSFLLYFCSTELRQSSAE